MDDIGAVAPAKARSPVEVRQPPERDRGTPSRRRPPRKPPSHDEMVDAEEHKLDFEA
jgi:hypothetical protein